MTALTISRRASLSTTPKTWDAEKRTMDVVFSAFADVQRPGYVERVTQEGLDPSRLVGSHVLMNHDASTVRNVLGIVVAARKDGTATIELSESPDVAPVVGEIIKGRIRNLSFSANVSAWRQSVDPKSGARIKTAVTWMPHEISFVAVPADPGATTRSQTMDPELETAPEQPAQDQPTVTERAALNTATRTLCREHGMSEQFTNNLVDGDLDMIARRAAVNAELIRRAPTIRATVGVDHTDPAAIMKRQIGGFVASAFGTKPADDEREFFGQTTVQVLRDMNERRGVNTRRMNDGDVIQRAFGTGDAPEFLTGVGNRVVLDAYTRATHPIMQLVQTRTVPDYRPVTFLRDSDFDGELEPVNEHGEFTRTSFGESKLSAQVEDFARGFDVTDKAIRNDDKGVITRVPAKFGAMAAAKDAALVLAVLSGNPVMDDGKTLFHADHSNLDTGNVPISLESVSDGRLAMRSLVGLAGEQLNIAPRYLVVSKELETAGEVFLASIQPTATSDAQPIKLTLIVEPGLPAFQWMLAADPAQAACLAILRLSGAEAPRIETAAAWNTFAMQFRCKHTVNAAAVGWRGLALWASGEDSNSQVF